MAGAGSFLKSTSPLEVPEEAHDCGSRRSGALKKEGWFIKMSFGDDASGVAALNALQSFTVRLDEKYGKRAFRYFSTANMQVLSKD